AHMDVHNAGHGNPVTVSRDGKYSIEFVECLASCGSAPVAMLNDDFHENVKLDAINELLNNRESDAIKPKLRPAHLREKRIVFANIDRDGWRNDIETYLNNGGYNELRTAVTMPPAEIVEE